MTENSSENLDSNFVLQGILEKFEGKSAIIKFSENQTLAWPITKLPEHLDVGMKIKLKILSDENDEAEKEKMAKIILNEILKEK